MPYAAKTKVDVDQTKIEIQKLLVKYGATGFAIAWMDGTESVAFEIAHWRIRFSFPELTPDDVRKDATGRERSPAHLVGGTVKSALEQAKRARWRELLLLIRAKLVAIENGVTTVEEEFHAHIILPNGQTMHEWATPYLKHAYLEGQMPPMLPPGGKDR